MHAERWRKHGDPLVGAKRKYSVVDAVCAIDGCEKPRHGREWCGMHYMRWRQHGDPSISLRDLKGWRVTVGGYIEVWEPDHPLAKAHGYVLEHRKVMHDAGHDLTGLHVHHIDGNKQNNAIENLELLTNSQHGQEHARTGTANQYGVWKPSVGMCSIEGCDKPVDSRGWCSAHYTRWLRHGDPLAGRRTPRARLLGPRGGSHRPARRGNAASTGR